MGIGRTKLLPLGEIRAALVELGLSEKEASWAMEAFDERVRRDFAEHLRDQNFVALGALTYRAVDQYLKRLTNRMHQVITQRVRVIQPEHFGSSPYVKQEHKLRLQ